MEKRIVRVLVTGGSGFLGRSIVKRASEAGHEILAKRSSEVNFYDLNGVDDFLSSQIRPVDAIIHSAAYYGGIGINEAEPASIFNINMQMALNVFEVAVKYGIKKVVPVGSACAYPGYSHGDLEESGFWDGALHESVEAYGMSKKVQLVAQRAYFKQHGIESNHLILTNLYGPHDVFTEYRSHVVSALIKKFVDADDEVILWGDGSPVREFLYVDDAAEAIVRSLEMGHDLDPINVGTGVGITIKELAELTAKFTDFRGKMTWDTSRPNGTARKVLDVQRMSKTLGWQPSWSFEEGLKSTVEWYLANKGEADTRQ